MREVRWSPKQRVAVCTATLGVYEFALEKRLKMKELKYFVACTVDGFIAARDGSLDAFVDDGGYFTELFASYPETCPGHLRKASGVRAENERFDTVLMGRNTYEPGLEVGLSSPYPTLKQYVFSTTMEESPDEEVTLVSEDAAGLVRGLKAERGKDIWLAGGATLAASLLSEGLIDELMLKVNPVVLGEGIPLFSGATKKVELDLEESRTFTGGVVLLRFRVKS
jgi:dihydrofolate reductase